MAKRRRRFRASDYGIIDCPNCGEGDQRNLGENLCSLCGFKFVVTTYGTKHRKDALAQSSPERNT